MRLTRGFALPKNNTCFTCLKSYRNKFPRNLIFLETTYANPGSIVQCVPYKEADSHEVYFFYKSSFITPHSLFHENEFQFENSFVDSLRVFALEDT